MAAVRGGAGVTAKNAKAGVKKIHKQNMRQSKRKMKTKQSAAAASTVAVTEERTTHAVIAASASPFVFWFPTLTISTSCGIYKKREMTS